MQCYLLFSDADVQGLSDDEVKNLQSLAFDSVHNVMRTEFNDSEVRYSKRRFSERGIGNHNDISTTGNKRHKGQNSYSQEEISQGSPEGSVTWFPSHETS